MQKSRRKFTVEVDVYDFPKFLKGKDDKNRDIIFAPHCGKGKYVIFKSPKRYIYICSEGIIYFNNIKDSIQIDYSNEYFNNGKLIKFSIMPETLLLFSLDKINKMVTSNRMKKIKMFLHEFVQTHGSRLEENYKNCLEELEKLGAQFIPIKIKEEK